MSSAPCKGNTLIIRLLPLQGVGGVWVPFTQGAALGYVLLPLRGVLFMSFDTPSYVIVGLSARIVYRQAPLVNIAIKH